MALNIYTISDPDLMYEAFNFVAMYMDTNANSSFMGALNAAFLVALLLYGFKSIQTQKFEWSQMLVTGVVVLSCIIPKDTVNIIPLNSANPTPVQVANVPIGIAAPFAIVSGFTNSIKDGFSTFLTVPGMVEFGAVDSLKLLMQLRDSPLIVDTNGAGGNMHRTIQDYMLNCVIPDTEGPGVETNDSKIMTASDAWAAMKTTWLFTDSTTWIPGVDPDNGTNRTCEDAFDTITTELQTGSVFRTAWDDQVLNYWMKGRYDRSKTLDSYVGDKLELIGLTAVQSTDYLRNTIAKRMYELSKGRYAASSGDVATAVIEAAAVNAKQTDWALGKSMFDRFSGPFASIVELIIVGFAPLVIIGIALGPGIALAGQYLSLLLWIGLWGPSMVIANVYIFYSTTKSVQGYSNNILTPSGLDYFNSTIADAIATGSMVTAGIPVIAGILAFGSAKGLQGLASKISESSANTDIASPKPVEVKATTTVDGLGNFSGRTGGFLDNTDRSTTINASSAGSFAVKASESAVHSAEANRDVSWQKGLMTGAERVRATGLGNSNDWSKSHEISTTMQRAASDAYALQDGTKEQKVDTTAIQVAGSAGISAKGFLAEAAVKALKNVGVSESKAVEMAETFKKAYEKTVTNLDKRGEGTSERQISEYRQTMMNKIGGGEGKSFGEAQRIVDSSRVEFQKVKDESNRGSFEKRMDGLQLGQLLSGKGSESEAARNATDNFLADSKNRAMAAQFMDSGIVRAAGAGDKLQTERAAAFVAMSTMGANGNAMGMRSDEAASNAGEAYLLRQKHGGVVLDNANNGVNVGKVRAQGATIEEVDKATKNAGGVQASAGKESDQGRPKINNIGKVLENKDAETPVPTSPISKNNVKIDEKDKKGLTDKAGSVANDAVEMAVDGAVGVANKAAKAAGADKNPPGFIYFPG